jgi:CheY-like chemotaxis protein/DNA-binding beta-propeller fold protein YncE
MDIRMPRMDGLEATRRLRDVDGVEVIVITTFDLDDYVLEALRAGAAGFLLKDSSPELVIDAVHAVARGDALLSETAREVGALESGRGLRYGCRTVDRRRRSQMVEERKLRLALSAALPGSASSGASLVTRGLAVLGGIVVCLAVAAACFASAARAGDRIYWANYTGNKISFANLDGSGGSDLVTTGATVSNPFGVAIDPAAGRIYWANFAAGKISFANLDGSGGGDLATTGATVNGPEGLAVDPGAGRVYWANNNVGKISFAKLDGSGGGDISTAGATVSNATGLAIDPSGGRVWWANSANKISFARLDGSGGADLTVTGATVNGPEGLALDPAAGRIYWANFAAAKVSFANLDGSAGADLATTGATVSNPIGVAVDPVAGRIWWANEPGPGTISFAKVDGSGGGDLATAGATMNNPEGVALLEVPRAAGVPTLAGGTAPGSVLSCSQGSWAPDLLSAFVYRAPQSIAYQWRLNDADIAGATANTVTASAPGDYRCTVTAANAAGSAKQTSAPHTVAAPPAAGPGPRPSKDTVAPRFVSFSLAPRAFAASSSGSSVQAARIRGTRITYRLSEAAIVTFRVERVLPGRRVRGRCVAPTRANRTRSRCERYRTLPGSFRRTSQAGSNALRFTGRLAGRKLQPGSYRLVAVGQDPAGNKSQPTRRPFRIIR